MKATRTRTATPRRRAKPAAGAGKLRMKDLCAATGLSRQAIHFYIQRGLLDEGQKSGRNMAWYGPEHVERVRLIRRLQEERFLPLRAIRALLAGDTAALPAPQQRLLAEIAARLPAELGGVARTVRLADALARHPIERDDLERLIALGYLPVRGAGADRELPADAERLLALWAQFRALGFTAERGFTADDLAIFADATERLVAAETELLLARFADLPAADAAPLLERALPVVHATLLHFHQAAVRAVFAAQSVRRPDAD